MNTNLRVFQSHEDGDLLIKFVLECSSIDRELMAKFGEPRIEVGGTFLTAATIHPVVNGSGNITSVVVDTAGSNGAYSAYVPVTVLVTDPGGLGHDATFSPVIDTATGTITGVTVLTQGVGYASNTSLVLTGDHVTTYPAQTVKLLSGFPYTRRINTVAAGDASLQTLATLYSNTLKTRVETALHTLRQLETGGFDLTKETVYQP